MEPGFEHELKSRQQRNTICRATTLGEKYQIEGDDLLFSDFHAHINDSEGSRSYKDCFNEDVSRDVHSILDFDSQMHSSPAVPIRRDFCSLLIAAIGKTFTVEGYIFFNNTP